MHVNTQISTSTQASNGAYGQVLAQTFTKIIELSKTTKIALVVFSFFALGLTAFALKKFYSRGFKDIPTGKVADVYVSLSGNPTHMGHMQMVALAVNRLKEEGYRVNEVKISLAGDFNVFQKVGGDNLLKKENDMEKVLLPLATRVKFLNAAILDAREKNVFESDLSIVYHEDNLFSTRHSILNDRKIFYVCGTDFADDDNGEFLGKERGFKHAVIVTRQGKEPKNIVVSDTEEFSRLIAYNHDKAVSNYSSSVIQNGAYELLPMLVREEFKKIHHGVQSEAILSQLDLIEEINKIQCPIAKETGRAVTRGFYKSPSGNEIPLSSAQKLLDGARVISNTLLEHAMEPRYEKSSIEVVEKDCLLAAEEELKNGSEKVAVLMLASPIEPGGGMEDGNNGQEEDLCRRSDIFGFMWDQSHFPAETSLYNLVDVERAHQVNPQYSSMNNNRMIHVPEVTVFRAGKTNNYQTLENPFKVGMLVSPGLDRPEYERVDEKTRYKRAEDEQQLTKLIMTQLQVSYDEGYDTVILGAFGCGAFYNPPELVAEFYKKIIEEYFNGAFKKIVFAILDDAPDRHNPDGNVRPFQNTFLK